MRLALAITYFATFGFWWPVYIGKRTRGALSLACIAAPWIGFWVGVLAR